ncbi:ERI1 exoribonuclease 2-like [Scleropages formosus]|uniref:ERI1 exoribonuclease 2-like n=1 Tax=Scleropages formosus TaxID=113540 RepID=A0A0P7UPR5_SCLFO|nr:ERI1 exoribonuclease 2-like [Scleropages formosus]
MIDVLVVFAVEFPAVLLNTSTGKIESEFHTYVQPQEHPILSDFCTELTGIKQVQVEAGVPLQICLSWFSRWLESLCKEKNIVFVKDNVCPPTACLCAFVTWSDWDLGICLQYECKRKQICKPQELNRWIDLRATYKLFYNRKPKGLNGALQDLGIEFSGREHSGLDDARNTAHLAWRMITDGCLMKVTKSLDLVLQCSIQVHTDSSHSTSSLDLSSLVNKTSVPSVRTVISNNIKVTAPLCNCGRRAKRLTVAKGGPNHGRVFYSCPVGKTGNTKGCGFFKWASPLVPGAKMLLQADLAQPVSEVFHRTSRSVRSSQYLQHRSRCAAREEDGHGVIASCFYTGHVEEPPLGHPGQEEQHAVPPAEATRATQHVGRAAGVEGELLEAPAHLRRALAHPP